jgi:hypothetical protein
MDNHVCGTLNKASKYGHAKCIRILIDCGANVNENKLCEYNIGWTSHALAPLTGSLCIKLWT